MRIVFKSVYGGADSAAVVRPVMAQLKAALADLAPVDRSRDLDEVTVRLFVPGELDKSADDPEGSLNFG